MSAQPRDQRFKSMALAEREDSGTINESSYRISNTKK